MREPEAWAVNWPLLLILQPRHRLRSFVIVERRVATAGLVANTDLRSQSQRTLPVLLGNGRMVPRFCLPTGGHRNRMENLVLKMVS